MRKLTTTIVVDTDNEAEVYDGINEGLRELQDQFGFIIDWAHVGTPEPVPGEAETYVEGQAFA